ncbi:heme biosynthesis protein HemY [Skermanella pratensis]|uniref:heme biosynthesis protein HemY n=1 Tax=Skermanella pratensis TaxID=2233999 RepID=UPI0013016A68|nr:heme biosynthesis protein HemY [Skermanella pratensis]
MAADNQNHDKAQDLAEEGLEKMIEGDRKEGEKLVEKARKLDSEAVAEVAQEVEEDRQQAEKFQK